MSYASLQDERIYSAFWKNSSSIFEVNFFSEISALGPLKYKGLNPLQRIQPLVFLYPDGHSLHSTRINSGQKCWSGTSQRCRRWYGK